MGGIENIMGMMKEFEGMEKKGELGDLMKMMGGGKGKGKGKRKWIIYYNIKILKNYFMVKIYLHILLNLIEL